MGAKSRDRGCLGANGYAVRSDVLGNGKRAGLFAESGGAGNTFRAESGHRFGRVGARFGAGFSAHTGRPIEHSAANLGAKSDAPKPPVSGQTTTAKSQPIAPQNQQPSADHPTSISPPSAHGQTQAPRPDGVDATAAEIGALWAKVLSPDALAKASVGNARNGWMDVARRMLPDVIDRFVPAGQPAWLRTLIRLTAGALVILVLHLIGAVLTFATTHKWTSFSALLLVLVGRSFSPESGAVGHRLVDAQPLRKTMHHGQRKSAHNRPTIARKSARLGQRKSDAPRQRRAPVNRGCLAAKIGRENGDG